jgi:hypothetical protein
MPHFGFPRSTIGYRLSAISYQLSAIREALLAIGYSRSGWRGSLAGVQPRRGRTRSLSWFYLVPKLQAFAGSVSPCPILHHSSCPAVSIRAKHVRFRCTRLPFFLRRPPSARSATRRHNLRIRLSVAELIRSPGQNSGPLFSSSRGD